MPYNLASPFANFIKLNLKTGRNWIVASCMGLACLSLPCAASETEKSIEKIFSENSKIRDLDRSLNISYQRLLNLLNHEEKAKLRTEQRQWIKERNKILTTNQDLQKLYEDRLEDLLKRLEECTQGTYLSSYIHGRPEINYEDTNLNETLSNCPLAICRAYKAFIDYDKSSNKQEILERTKQTFNQIAEDMFSSSDGYIPYDLKEFKQQLEDNPVDAFLSVLATHNLYSHLEDRFDRIPVWLVLKHPEILNHTTFRFSPRVLADRSILNIDEFIKLKETISEMWDGRFIESSCCQRKGTIRLDLYAYYANLIAKLSFVPSTLTSNKSIPLEDNRISLKAWSLRGIWNRLTYQTFINAFDKAVIALEKYYNENYNLKGFAAQAEKLLIHYISVLFPQKLASDSLAFHVINTTDGALEELKKTLQTFEKKEWDELLHMAILADWDRSTIEWIITSGADVNHALDHETPLMNAVTRPDILTMLIEHGADIKTKTPMGKTALFYAVQFGPKESVEILVKKGAPINDSIKSLAEFENNLDCDFYSPEIVADFTPLVYALRYGTKEVIQLLQNNGATLGKVHDRAQTEDTLKEWVYKNRNIPKSELEEIIKDILKN